jgi:hypothetical protein
MTRKQTTLLLTRKNNWQSLDSSLYPNSLITGIEINESGKFVVKRIDWNDYWLTETDSHSAELNELKQLRMALLSKPDELDSMKEYVQCYFEFLHNVCNDEAGNVKLQQKLTALETFPVFYKAETFPSLIAVDTSYNPVYLLSRIIHPNSWHNPRFLPLVQHSESHSTLLYHHYRQISAYSRTLFTYIPNEPQYRQRSFIAWQKLAVALTVKRDTLVQTRAERLAQNAVLPLISRIPGYRQSMENVLRIADLGGGSADLTKKIVEQLLSNEKEKPKIDLTVVDLDFPDMQRHLKYTPFYRSLSSFKCHRNNFYDWVCAKYRRDSEFCIKYNVSAKQETKKYDFIFLFRLLNNLSKFDIIGFSEWFNVHRFMNERITKTDWLDGKTLPHLALQNDCIGNIVLAAKKVNTRDGISFTIPSLTDYFQTLSMLSSNIAKQSGNAVYLPVRHLDLQSVLPPDGINFFQMLCSLCHFVVIEDIDLTASQLRRYLDENNLTNLSVQRLRSGIPNSQTLVVFENK